jgi:hypothetical protein
MGQATRGGPSRVVLAICFPAASQGQSVGRCSLSRRAERVSRPGTLISWARMVAVVAWRGRSRRGHRLLAARQSPRLDLGPDGGTSAFWTSCLATRRLGANSPLWPATQRLDDHGDMA